ncbi:hypothetical protein [Antarctobacter sp.]|uniref:hypothetical protein n=1 Tax=Antarctobacter sp. TaxID=1872577 RepID=UPI002B26B052|nr:hypothetical protein [Antarctobacter sp.]
MARSPAGLGVMDYRQHGSGQAQRKKYRIVSVWLSFVTWFQPIGVYGVTKHPLASHDSGMIRTVTGLQSGVALQSLKLSTGNLFLWIIRIVTGFETAARIEIVDKLSLKQP